MPKFFGELKAVQFELLGSAPTNLPLGRFYYDTADDAVKYKAAGGVRQVVDLLKLAELSLANPMTAEGDLMYGGVSGAVTVLPKGPADTLLMTGDVPAWTKITNVHIDAAAGIAQSKILDLTTDLGTLSSGISSLSSALAGKANTSDLANYATTASVTSALSSKLDSTSGVASQLRISDFLDFTHQTTPANPASGRLRVFAKADNKLYQIDSGGIEKLLAGGGSGEGAVNYVPDGTFELSTNGVKPTNWTAYLDAAGVAPVDGTGGSPNANVTFLASNTSPLRGDLSAILSKDAVNRQGTGYSCPITIAKADRSKTLRLYVETEASTNYVAGDAALYLYDITNSVLITPTVASIPKQDGASWEIEFDLTTSTSYRLCLHIASTSALAWTLKVDSMILNGEKIGSAANKKGPRVLFTPTFNNVSVTNNGSYYQKDGEDVEVTLDVSAAGSASGIVFFNPSSLGIAGVGVDPVDYNVLPTRQNIGSGLYISSTKNWVVAPSYGGTQNQIRFALNDNTSSVGNAAPSGETVVTNTRLTARFKLPISVWAGSFDSAAAYTDEEYASVSGTWDADSSTTVYGPGGSLMGGALTTSRVKTITWQRPVQTGDVFIVEASKDQINWVPIDGAQIGPSNTSIIRSVNSISDTVSGALYRPISTTQTAVVFGRYANIANDDSPTSDWPTSQAYWRVRKFNPKKPAGVYKAGPNNSGFLKSYDEGTFTPTLQTNGGAQVQATGVRLGSYTKIGREVTISCQVAPGTVAALASGSLTISGLPFPAAGGITCVCRLYVGSGVTNPANSLASAVIASGNSVISLTFSSTNGGADSAMALANISSAFSVNISCTYQAAN